MKIVADLHIHSKYSRATSPLMEVESMAPWAKKKGITVLGTGDFTHPEYFKLLKSKLKEGPAGLYTLKKGGPETAGVHFMLTSEISNIFTQGGKGRRVHTLVFAPSLEVVGKINKAFAARGNVASDGRPIFGFSAKELVKIVLDISPECFIVPAHVWTPWFAVFGSKSGFDSLEECFEEESKNIHAIETGLSSDMTMNRRLSGLDNITLISNSDAHSVSRLGREANVLECELSYKGIIDSFRNVDSKNFLYTIEYFPDEGRYHYDGHRTCHVCLHPRESKERKNRCPVCFKPLTLGVMHRVEDLADRAWDYKPEGFVPQKHAVQLVEILSEALETGPASKKVSEYYDKIMSKGVSELDLLLESTPDELSLLVLPRVREGILLVREGKVSIAPGYDGEYGKVMLFGKEGGEPRLKRQANRKLKQPELF